MSVANTNVFKHVLQNLKSNNSRFLNEFKNGIETIINDNNYILGRQVLEFENKFKKYLGMDYCVGVSSGTSALELALQSLNLQHTDEIIIQANTYIATAFAAYKTNAKLNIIDVENDSTIDLNKLKSQVNDNTRVIIVVHMYGDCVIDMYKLRDYCDSVNIKLIEDCAQCLGGKYKNKLLGSFGDLTCFSFYPTKNLGCLGDGGAICVNNVNYYTTLLKLRNLGCIEKYHHEMIATNSRLDPLQAYFLNIKLDFLDDDILNKRCIVGYYLHYLKNNPNVIHLHNSDSDVYHAYHLFVIQVNNRDSLMQYLINNGIESLIHYKIPFYKTKAFEFINTETCANTELLSDTILSLPLDAFMTQHDVQYICDKINSFYNL